MDLTTAVSMLGDDYVNKITNAMEKSINLKTPDTTDSGSAFNAIYKSVSSMLGSTNDYVQRAQQAEVDFALGKMTNTHELGVYQQEANIALQYTVAVRDKVIEAYNSIMNMQM